MKKPKLPDRGGNPGKVTRLAKLVDKGKSDYSVRFPSPRDYMRIRHAAKSYGVSINMFIVQAALRAASNQAIAKDALAFVDKKLAG